MVPPARSALRSGRATLFLAAGLVAALIGPVVVLGTPMAAPVLVRIAPSMVLAASRRVVALRLRGSRGGLGPGAAGRQRRLGTDRHSRCKHPCGNPRDHSFHVHEAIIATISLSRADGPARWV